jgi:hypothetical protein
LSNGYRSASGQGHVTAPLNLAILAAYIPDSYIVEIIDEDAGEYLDPEKDADMVGITCLTSSVTLPPKTGPLANRICRV